MNEFKVSYNGGMRYTTKPDKYAAAMISDRLPNCAQFVDKDKIKSFVGLVSGEGTPFCPATFKGGIRSKESFEQQQLFALDFDGGISFEEVKTRTEKYELPILFAYDTLSSRNPDKFRVVFLNDVSVSDRKVAEAMQQAMGTIFPEADSSCYKDISKMYYGGKGMLHYDDGIPKINIESVFRNMTCYLKEKHKPNHYKEQIARFSKDTGIGLNKNGLLDITVTDNPTELPGATQSNQNGKNSPSPIIYKSLYRIANGEIFPNKYYCINFVDSGGTCKPSVGKITLKNHDDYRSYILKDISRCCQLFRDFDTGSRKLNHDELFGIATNLIQVDTGLQRFKDILSANYHFYDGKIEKWSHDLSYMKQLNYHPQGCDSFCPYRKECAHGANILSTSAPKRGTMERIPGCKEKFDSVKDVEKDVYHATREVYMANDNNWHIIKAMTGAGKTTTYLKLMSDNPTNRLLIAAPTNILKNEIYDKALRMGIEVAKTPSLEEIKDEIPHKVWKHIQRLYKTGLHRSVHPYIHETLKKKNIPCLGEYLKEREDLKTFAGSVITTHRYLLNMDEKRLNEYDSVIIDEDLIFKSIISNQCEITISDLKKLSKETTDIGVSKK